MEIGLAFSRPHSCFFWCVWGEWRPHPRASPPTPARLLPPDRASPPSTPCARQREGCVRHAATAPARTLGPARAPRSMRALFFGVSKRGPRGRRAGVSPATPSCICVDKGALEVLMGEVSRLRAAGRCRAVKRGRGMRHLPQTAPPLSSARSLSLSLSAHTQSPSPPLPTHTPCAPSSWPSWSRPPPPARPPSTASRPARQERDERE
jgi:hypothetical protein